MHAESLLHGWLGEVLSWMHGNRREAVEAVVISAIRGKKLTVTELGRSIKSQAKEKHCIKRADRLLSNIQLQEERTEVYESLAKRIIGGSKRIVIIVDWSDLSERGGLSVLRASTPVKGRSLTLYEEVHNLSEKEQRKTHRRFLKRLQKMLPEECYPIVVTDAGFRTPWFKDIEKLGWDWVGRIRNPHLIQFESGRDWTPCKSLFQQANSRPKVVGEVFLTRSNPIKCRLVLYKAKPKGRIMKNMAGKRASTTNAKYCAVRGREPWLLATSLKASLTLAMKVVKLYATRMQIEEAFRDLKSARYGLSLEHSGTQQRSRLAIMLLIASLATTLLWLVGKATELTGQHRQYQANTIKHRTVLSLIFLGSLVANDLRLRFLPNDFLRAEFYMGNIIADYAHGC